MMPRIEAEEEAMRHKDDGWRMPNTPEEAREQQRRLGSQRAKSLVVWIVLLLLMGACTVWYGTQNGWLVDKHPTPTQDQCDLNYTVC
jgi:hypothetical protein